MSDELGYIDEVASSFKIAVIQELNGWLNGMSEDRSDPIERETFAVKMAQNIFEAIDNCKLAEFSLNRRARVIISPDAVGEDVQREWSKETACAADPMA